MAETVRIAERMADIERERANRKWKKIGLRKTKRRTGRKALCREIENGTDLEVALDNMEDVLKQAYVPENEWVTNLKAVVMGKHADLVHSLKFFQRTLATRQLNVFCWKRQTILS